MFTEGRIVEAVQVEDEIENLLENLETGLDSCSLPIECDDRGSDSDSKNTSEEKEEKIIEAFEGLVTYEVPALGVMQNHAKDGSIEDIKGKVDTSETLGPSIRNS